MRNFAITFILIYLRILARIALVLHRPYVIGIAGSAGKSSARNAVYAATRDSLAITVIDGNSETGIPLGLLGLKPHGYRMHEWLPLLMKAPFGINYLKGYTHIIVEMGIDDPHPPKNMEYLLTIIRPNLAVSLNVSATHTYQFEKILPQKTLSESEKKKLLIQAIAREDTKIITESGCHIAIYNQDDIYISDALSTFLSSHTVQTFTFGSKKSATITFETYTPSLKGTRFTYSLNYGKDREKITLNFNGVLLPEVYQETIAAAILVAFSFGIPTGQIVTSLQNNLELPKGRTTLLNGVHNTTIIDSTYNSSKRSVISFLELVHNLKKSTGKHVVFLCGDMNELGVASASEHRELITPISQIVDVLYCVGPETKRYIFEPLTAKKTHFKEILWFPTARVAGAYVKDHIQDGAIILAKGSQNRVFLEEAVKTLLIDKRDTKKLCRQEDYWMDMKRTYFNQQERNSKT